LNAYLVLCGKRVFRFHRKIRKGFEFKFNIFAIGFLASHRAAVGFVRKHRRELAAKKVGYFLTALSMTQVPHHLEGISVAVDPALAKAPKKGEGRLSFKERYARLSNYVQPILTAARPAKPVSIGVFGGRMEYGRLKWWAVLFVMVIIQARAGDLRNWDAIRLWAASLPAAFQL